MTRLRVAASQQLLSFDLPTSPPGRESFNVGHERRLEAGKACWKTSARWKG